MLENNRRTRLLSSFLHCCIGFGLFSIHVLHVSSIFELETKITDPAKTKIEKEMLFTGEDALYYSYYRTIAEAPSFSIGINKLIYNNLTEHPNTVNVIQKFYIYPEIVIGFLYKHFMTITTHFGIKTMSCWMVGSDSQLNCDGPGIPLNFYLECVWFMGGFSVFILFVYATYLSRNIIGGLSAVAYFFSIHNDGTQIHRNPAARENFAMPFLLWQMSYLTMCIEKHQITKRLDFKNCGTMVTKLTILSLFANLSWQFSSYIFATQIAILLILLYLGMISVEFYSACVLSHIFANSIAYCMMFENENFFLSGYNNLSLIFIPLNVNFLRMSNGGNNNMESQRFLSFGNAISKCVLITNVYFVVHSLVRAYFYTTEHIDDVFVLYKEIILTKLHMQPPTFTTLLYLCNPQMSFIDFDTLKTYNKLFVGKFVGVFVVIWLSKWLQKRREISENDTDKIERSKNYLIEDFLEENRVSMKDLVNEDTDKQIKDCLEVLKQCNYDYELYKRKKKKSHKVKIDEKAAFLNDMKKLKEEINEKEKLEKDGVRKVETTNEKQNFDQSKEETAEDDGKTSYDNVKEEDVLLPETDDQADIVYSSYFVQPHYLFNILQTICFVIMAGLVFKLKYVLTPFMCAIASSFPPKNWFAKSYNRYWLVYLVLVFCSIADTGVQNLQNQYQIKEDSTDHSFEHLIHWINVNTDREAVFAGPSNIITTVMLTTKRPIVNHPRYEFGNMRERTKLVYSILSKEPAAKIYNKLAQLNIQYIILPFNECISSSRSCKISDIWDIVEPEYRDNIQLCAELFQKTNANFLRVFMNEHYIILKIFSQSVQLEFNINGSSGAIVGHSGSGGGSIMTELNM